MVATGDWRSNLRGPVVVLLGGHSAERDVSLESGGAVLKALQSRGIDAEALDTRDDGWLQRLASYHHAFIALHGGDGEDGTIQATLQNMGISYTGSGVAASALAMDKIRCKYLWKGMGLPTAAFEVLSADCDWEQVIARLGKVIVKPATEGSSIGMSIAATAAELEAAYALARPFKSAVLAERWIEGAEYTVAILGERALPAIRLETDHSFYDYEAKYISDDTRYICPCGLSDDEEREMQLLALEAFNSLGCRGWARADFMRDKDGRFYLLEVNTVPGMTSHSLVPMAARASGLEFDALVEEILHLSVEVGA